MATQKNWIQCHNRSMRCTDANLLGSNGALDGCARFQPLSIAAQCSIQMLPLEVCSHEAFADAQQCAIECVGNTNKVGYKRVARCSVHGCR